MVAVPIYLFTTLLMITERKKQERQSSLQPSLHFLKIDHLKIVGLGQRLYLAFWVQGVSLSIHYKMATDRMIWRAERRNFIPHLLNGISRNCTLNLLPYSSPLPTISSNAIFLAPGEILEKTLAFVGTPLTSNWLTES